MLILPWIAVEPWGKPAVEQISIKGFFRMLWKALFFRPSPGKKKRKKAAREPLAVKAMANGLSQGPAFPSTPSTDTAHPSWWFRGYFRLFLVLLTAVKRTTQNQYPGNCVPSSSFLDHAWAIAGDDLAWRASFGFMYIWYARYKQVSFSCCSCLVYWLFLTFSMSIKPLFPFGLSFAMFLSDALHLFFVRQEKSLFSLELDMHSHRFRGLQSKRTYITLRCQLLNLLIC